MSGCKTYLFQLFTSLPINFFHRNSQCRCVNWCKLYLLQYLRNILYKYMLGTETKVFRCSLYWLFTKLSYLYAVRHSVAVVQFTVWTFSSSLGCVFLNEQEQ